MELSTGIFIAVLGYKIFKEIFQENPEQKAVREATEQERQKKHLEAMEIAQRERERQQALKAALEEEKRKPFKTAADCFKEQYVSYARISTYNSCPHRFKLIYLDKHDAGSSGFLNYSKGAAFHMAIERYLKKYLGKLVTGLDYKEIVNEAFNLRYLKSPKWYWSPDRRGRENIKRKKFRDNAKFFCKTFPENVKIVAVEQELPFTVDKIKFYGIADLIIRYPDDHIEIVDYKTGERLPIKEQLEIYSIPYTQGKDCPSISFRIICVDRQSHYRWSQNKIEMIKNSKNILSIVNTIMSDSSFVPCIGSHCKNCSMGHICKYSKNYEKNGEVSNISNKLTRLTPIYEWKHGVVPPKSVKSKLNNSSTPKKYQGLSYSLSQATREYECWKTKRHIQIGEYHFVDHKGKRFCIDAFRESYPDRANELIKKKQDKLERKTTGGNDIRDCFAALAMTR
ncbi:MAG: PD-(D/E)XK nuclease family protein [Sedimentisphaerales bacterium]